MAKELSAHYVALTLFHGMPLAGRPDVSASGITRETVYWRWERGGWATVLWFTATNYAPGLVRLRNGVVANIPKTCWPFSLPKRPSFELTFHSSEVKGEIGGALFAYCAASAGENLVIGWELFEEERSYPRYAWTKKARQFVTSSQSHT
jgi:hypothetical protein